MRFLFQRALLANFMVCNKSVMPAMDRVVGWLKAVHRVSRDSPSVIGTQRFHRERIATEREIGLRKIDELTHVKRKSDSASLHGLRHPLER